MLYRASNTVADFNTVGRIRRELVRSYFNWNCHSLFISELFVSSSRQLRPVSDLKDLGVTVSSTLSWSPQVNRMATKARAIASCAVSAFEARGKTEMLNLYNNKSLIRSQLEYCCLLWNCH